MLKDRAEVALCRALDHVRRAGDPAEAEECGRYWEAVATMGEDEAMWVQADQDGMSWRIIDCSWHDKPMQKTLLVSGREPFAVTAVESDRTVWLRRPAMPHAADVEPIRPRGEVEAATP